MKERLYSVSGRKGDENDPDLLIVHANFVHTMKEAKKAVRDLKDDGFENVTIQRMVKHAGGWVSPHCSPPHCDRVKSLEIMDWEPMDWSAS